MMLEGLRVNDGSQLVVDVPGWSVETIEGSPYPVHHSPDGEIYWGEGTPWERAATWRDLAAEGRWRDLENPNGPFWSLFAYGMGNPTAHNIAVGILQYVPIGEVREAFSQPGLNLSAAVRGEIQGVVTASVQALQSGPDIFDRMEGLILPALTAVLFAPAAAGAAEAVAVAPLDLAASTPAFFDVPIAELPPLELPPLELPPLELPPLDNPVPFEISAPVDLTASTPAISFDVPAPIVEELAPIADAPLIDAPAPSLEEQLAQSFAPGELDPVPQELLAPEPDAPGPGGPSMPDIHVPDVKSILQTIASQIVKLGKPPAARPATPAPRPVALSSPAAQTQTLMPWLIGMVVVKVLLG